MKLIFMGSGAFAVPSLETLIASPAHDVVALVTQPDKPAGRGHRLRVPPTKPLALDAGIEIHQPVRVRHEESVERVKSLAPECIVVVAYGQIIPKSILDIPPKGIINVHASLLPRYRGAAPIQWAIAACESETGVTTMLMDEGLDTGPVLMQESTPISGDDTSATLEPRLAAQGAGLLERTLEAWAGGTLVPRPQDDAKATMAPRIKKDDALLDWGLPSDVVACRIRAFDPWPVAHTTLEGATLRIWKAVPIALSGSGAPSHPPGEVVAVRPDGVEIACGRQTRLLLQEVQPSGKARMAAADFARGKRLRAGAPLGE